MTNILFVSQHTINRRHSIGLICFGIFFLSGSISNMIILYTTDHYKNVFKPVLIIAGVLMPVGIILLISGIIWRIRLSHSFDEETHTIIQNDYNNDGCYHNIIPPPSYEVINQEKFPNPNAYQNPPPYPGNPPSYDEPYMSSKHYGIHFGSYPPPEASHSQDQSVLFGTNHI